MSLLFLLQQSPQSTTSKYRAPERSHFSFALLHSTQRRITHSKECSSTHNPETSGGLFKQQCLIQTKTDFTFHYVRFTKIASHFSTLFWNNLTWLCKRKFSCWPCQGSLSLGLSSIRNHQHSAEIFLPELGVIHLYLREFFLLFLVEQYFSTFALFVTIWPTPNSSSCFS